MKDGKKRHPQFAWLSMHKLVAPTLSDSHAVAQTLHGLT